MFSYIWHTFFFDPVYNGLVFFVDTVPGGDVGLAIIFTTIVVKVILLPLSIKAAKTQRIMRILDPKLKEIKEKFKDKREEQARKMLDLYREHGVNPFASILLMFIQIPVIIALYLAVYRGGGVPLPDINLDLLYSFITVPEQVTMLFLGAIDIAERSLPLAILAGITQFIHAQLSIPKMAARKEGEAPSMKDDFMRSMNIQMRYILPLVIFGVAYTFAASIALYFTISNLVSIAQEYIVRRHAPRDEAEEETEAVVAKK